MTLQQRIAADPAHSVWVAASAGTGKTKVLTDRVLRLLLQGVKPERVLCLTYTKAAAAEMASRIQAELAEWAVCDEESLLRKLETLIETVPTAKQLQRARQLFATVLEAPEGLRMLTIHSLCQSLLRRFSLEAGVSPHFRVMEEREAKLLIDQARQQLFREVRGEEATPLAEAIKRLAGKVPESAFNALLDEIINRRPDFQTLLRPPGGVQEARQRIFRAAGWQESDWNEEMLFTFHFNYHWQLIDEFKFILPYIREGKGQSDQRMADAIRRWLAMPARNALAAREWVNIFLTTTHEKRKTLITQDVVTRYPEAETLLRAEQQRCYEYQQQLMALRTAQHSVGVLTLAEAILAIYTAMKQQRGLMDYEDLTGHASRLLAQPDIAPWVLYKLDGGIDHLLVDEAQDTSPVQWRLIEALAADFFSGESAAKAERTLFVVGDEKQSIYSFQGAQPRIFAEMKQHFAQRIKAAQKSYHPVSLSLSYRSTAAVLKLVDATFAADEHRTGVIFSENEIRHQAHREAPGRVELWPLVVPAEKQEREAWTIPEAGVQASVPEQILAESIATRIQGWLREQIPLPSRGRAIRPGDILVLVRRRHRFFDYLIAALKKRGVPLAGADRMRLNEHIAVQDMLALGQFLLLPEDDLTLACLLKSPLFGLNEEQLFDLCYERKGTLWHRLREQMAAPFPAIAARLEALLAEVDYLPPYELFARALNVQGGRQRFRSRMGAEVDDPLDEFLALALEYETLHTPSLQGFLHWFGQVETEVKRDMEQSEDKVRIMTVHGAKGLQAPIVILPDTTAMPRSTECLLWQEGSFLWAHDAGQECEAVRLAKERRKQEERQEYRRLLYVALTRAADELIIAGWQGEKEVPQECWYRQVQQAMQSFAQETEDGRWVWEDAGYVQHLSPPLREGSEESTSELSSLPPLPQGRKALPAWLVQPAPEEPVPPRPLMPSRPRTPEPAADSALEPRDRFVRGAALHHLLEVLPDLPPHSWQSAAEMLLKRLGITGEQEADVVREVMTVLRHPDFAPVFGPGSQAEVPVTALLTQEGTPRILSGRIDRLVVLPDKVLIVDYKTTRQIPATAHEIPLYFRQQLESYVRAIEKLYPSRSVEAAILWTAAPLLMPLPDIAAMAA